MEPAELLLILDRVIQDRSTHLDLYQHQLDNLPDSIGNLTDLVSLRLVDNRLTSLPDSIGNLTKLRELRLYKNQLGNLPASIANLQNLTYLSLSLNRLTVFPESITELTNLTELLLNGNRLVVLPQSISKLTNLTCLDITGNPLMDLSILNSLPKLKTVKFWGINLPRKYWTEIKLLHSSLRIVDRNILKIEIRNNNLNYLVGRSLIRIPKDLQRISLLNSNKNTLRSHLYLSRNNLTSIPPDIGNLTQLTYIELSGNKLTSLPASIGNLNNLSHLDLQGNQLSFLPSSIDNLTNLTHLYLGGNLFDSLPDAIGEMSKLTHLHVNANLLTSLPTSIRSLRELTSLELSGNPLTDLSILQHLPKLKRVYFLGRYLSRRYWTKLSEWKAEWLRGEQNAELRQRLIQQIGYERICQELEAIQLDSWREYTLLKIDIVERFYDWRKRESIQEPMVLLKMTCPSTRHIHVLRVPPEMTSAEAAITWINHGIHPDRFIIQT
jgi:leucine-rich repeat protein SHOC2